MTDSAKHVKNGSLNVSEIYHYATFSDPDYPVDITDIVKNQLKNQHPSRVIGDAMLNLSLYKIDYTYTTERGRDREKEKYIFLDSKGYNEIELRLLLESKLLGDLNKIAYKNQHRKVSNVKILDYFHVANAKVCFN